MLPDPERLDGPHLVAGREVAFDAVFQGASVRTDDGVDVALAGPQRVLVGSYEAPSGRRACSSRARGCADPRGARSAARPVDTAITRRSGRSSAAATRKEVWIAAVGDPWPIGVLWLAVVGGLLAGSFVLLMFAAVGAVCVLPANASDVVDDGRGFSMMALGAATPFRTKALRTEGNIIVASLDAPIETRRSRAGAPARPSPLRARPRRCRRGERARSPLPRRDAAARRRRDARPLPELRRDASTPTSTSRWDASRRRAPRAAPPRRSSRPTETTSSGWPKLTSWPTSGSSAPTASSVTPRTSGTPTPTASRCSTASASPCAPGRAGPLFLSTRRARPAPSSTQTSPHLDQRWVGPRRRELRVEGPAQGMEFA